MKQARQDWPISNSFELTKDGLNKYLLDEDKPARLKGGRVLAAQYMNEFFTQSKLLAYPGSISNPNTAVSGCSRLSPYLAYGVVSQRELIKKAVSQVSLEKLSITKTSDIKEFSPEEGVRFFLERLYWRSAFLQRFEINSKIEVEIEDKKMIGAREQEFEDALFEAWCAGRTGVPIIDAAMRMLKQTGWINMRMRGMLLSFAANELWLHWRKPGLFLAKQFLDYEPAIHWHQMQIQSATALAQPLIYNPIKQSKEQDENGVFIRKWVPELYGLSSEDIHEPWLAEDRTLRHANVFLGSNYPKPVVPLDAAAECAKKTITALKEGQPVPNLGYAKARKNRIFKQIQTSLF